MNIAFIPLRYGSKSIPLKNIKIFCGRPLIYWSLKALEDSTNIDQIYVATDCESIKSIVNEFKFSKVSVFERSNENAQDKSTTESVMLEFLSKQKFNDDDIFLLVQATSPLTKTEDFDGAIDYYKIINSEDDIIRLRKQKSNKVKVDQTVVHGDYVDDRDTIVKDSVINRSNIGAGSDDKIAKLEKIAEMKKEGLIDDDEFKQMKKEILGK